MKIQAILLDVDGVLCDCVSIHFAALNEALQEVGFNIEADEEAKYNGLPTKVKLRMLSEDKQLPYELHSQIFTRKQYYTQQKFHSALTIDRDKINLLNTLRSHGCKIAVCSNAIRESVCAMIAAIGVDNLVDVYLGNEDTPNPKPAPDIYLEAAKRLNIAIESCVIVEDSEVGLCAAYAANPAKVVRVGGPHQVNLQLLDTLIGNTTIDNGYSTMQRINQDNEAKQWSLDNRDYITGSFTMHNAWSDYRQYLFQGMVVHKDAAALDFGCGFGRCMVLFKDIFASIDGVDISPIGLTKTREYLAHEQLTNFNLYLTNGTNLDQIPDNKYNVVYSTICLQHVCVHDIRLSLMKEFLRVLMPGGWFTAQMGYGKNHPRSVSYHANNWGATGTNGAMDCRVESPHELESDLQAIGFENFQYWLRPTGPQDVHSQWIFFRAQKPLQETQ